MKPTPLRAPGDDRRIDMYRREVTERAALLHRLGYSAEQAAARICANAAWDFEVGAGPRPEALGDAAVTEMVRHVYARRPAR